MTQTLNQHWFLSLPDARFHVERYRRDYNEVRPHSALDNKMPGEFAREHGATVALPHPPRLSLRVA